jgi:hypothetical protein
VPAPPAAGPQTPAAGAPIAPAPQHAAHHPGAAPAAPTPGAYGAPAASAPGAYGAPAASTPGAYGAPTGHEAATAQHEATPAPLPEPADFVEQADDEPTEAKASKRPSPILLGALALVLIGGAAYNFVLKPTDEPAPDPVTPAASTAAPAGADATASGNGGGGTAASIAASLGAGPWADAVPKEIPGGVTDETTLDAREVAPSRFSHQVEVLEGLLSKTEKLYTVKVQNDGTLVGLISDGNTTRWAATKKDLDPQPAPAVSYIAGTKPLESTDFIAKVPGKFLKAAQRAGGVAPGSLTLVHPEKGAFGDSPTWAIQWTGVPGTTVLSTVDGHDLTT